MTAPKAAKAAKKPTPAKAPPAIQVPRLPITKWVVVGLDLSLSRTGYAIMEIQDGVAKWQTVGSIYPRGGDKSTWARGAAIALQLREMIEKARRPGWGHIVVFETPDPNNSYLMALNGIVQTILWCSSGAHSIQELDAFWRLNINAMTLRATLRLNVKLQGDKEVNRAMAETFLDEGRFPNLDTDACDAVLLAMMGRHAAVAQNGFEATVPPAPLNLLCSLSVRVKKRKTTDKETGEAAIILKEKAAGLLHNPEAWTRMVGPVEVALATNDAEIVRAVNPATKLYL